MRVSVLTISDSVSRGKSEDRSGPALVARCRELGWKFPQQKFSRMIATP